MGLPGIPQPVIFGWKVLPHIEFLLLVGFFTVLEIETGKSNFIRNVQQDLAAKYNKVLVIATDKPAFEKIEKKLAQAGLLIPGRVELAIQNN